ncbi:MAG: DUF1080 domain-containing protein [Planctomycetales bacterium]|nr:DUF1080 domain-containing protein [Planctomycetales bacterium]
MRITTVVSVLVLVCSAGAGLSAQAEEGWVSLFNGKDLSGWKVSENKDTFSVKDGEMVVKGPRAHAFYVGEVGGADFRNFEWKCEIMTKPNANSGMYFHTQYQEEGWPDKGYEAQVNQTHPDPRKTGGLYGAKDVMDKSPVKDNEWFTQHVVVRGKHVTVSVNGKVTCDYTEPEDYTPPSDRPGRVLSHGTIAIQGHDPGSEIHYRKIMIKPLD